MGTKLKTIHFLHTQNKTGYESSEICSLSTQNHFLTNFLPVWACRVRVQISTDMHSDQKP